MIKMMPHFGVVEDQAYQSLLARNARSHVTERDNAFIDDSIDLALR